MGQVSIILINKLLFFPAPEPESGRPPGLRRRVLRPKGQPDAVGAHAQVFPGEH